jgi:hypothetical protein
MTWAQFVAARQLITEERLGAPLRAARRVEDEAAAETAAALKRQVA